MHARVPIITANSFAWHLHANVSDAKGMALGKIVVNFAFEWKNPASNHLYAAIMRIWNFSTDLAVARFKCRDTYTVQGRAMQAKDDQLPMQLKLCSLIMFFEENHETCKRNALHASPFH